MAARRRSVAARLSLVLSTALSFALVVESPRHPGPTACSNKCVDAGPPAYLFARAAQELGLARQRWTRPRSITSQRRIDGVSADFISSSALFWTRFFHLGTARRWRGDTCEGTARHSPRFVRVCPPSGRS